MFLRGILIFRGVVVGVAKANHQKFNHNTRKKNNERGLALHRCLRNSVPQTCVVRPKPGLASYVEEITVYSGIQSSIIR